MYYCTVTSIKHMLQSPKHCCSDSSFLEMHRIVRRPIIAAVAVGTGTLILKNDQTLLGMS